MRNNGRWIRAIHCDGESYTVAFGALLEFVVARRRSSEARILWTVSLNGRELDWCASFDAACARVEDEARAMIAPTLEGWQIFRANASAVSDAVRRTGR
jgi:hypothetical protein